MMRDDKLIELFEFYAKHGADMPHRLEEQNYSRKRRDFIDMSGDELISMSRAPRHAAWMAQQAIGFIKEARKLEGEIASISVGARKADLAQAKSKREKAHRWLGFIQGVLWMAGVYTLDELKEHARRCSDEPEKAESS